MVGLKKGLKQLVISHTHTHTYGTDRLDRSESCYRYLQRSRQHRLQPRSHPWRSPPGEKVSCSGGRSPQTPKNKYGVFRGTNRSLTNESTPDWFYIRVPDESVWPARGLSSHRCWCGSSPRGRACPHTRCADALVGTEKHDGRHRSYTKNPF